MPFATTAITAITATTHPSASRLLAARVIFFCIPLWSAGLQAKDVCDAVTPEAVLQSVNAARTSGLACGAKGPPQRSAALRWNPALARAAQDQADWLARHGLLVHVGPLGESLASRVAAADYRHARISENLAAGQGSVAGAVRAWEASTTHCRSLVDPLVTETALACARADDGEPFYVMLLGRPQ